MAENTTLHHDFARQFAQQTNRNIFLTGKAGTGKTTFLHQLREITGKQLAVVAPTGVAAINAGGTTIHSFFQLPFTPFIPTAEGKKDLIGKLKMQQNRRNVIRELELLVIDEVSMVRVDVLDAIDTILRHIRYRHNEPFGGVQIIFIGDMYQLSPVAQNEEWQILSKFYKSIYFFHSQVISQNQPIYIELEKVFRQKDMRFIQLLNEVRNNCLTENGLKLLQERYIPAFVPPKDDTHIILTTHNYKADRINSEELIHLKNKSIYYTAIIKGDFPEKSYPMEERLELKIGAKVMFIKNDTETPRRFYNGKIGKITAFEGDKIIVKCPDDKDDIEVNRMIWNNIRYKSNDTTLKVEEEIAGTFTQFPLRLAWAITIHKSQGLTFDKAVIDAEAAFASGQVYVALSRCRSLEGIVLQTPINKFLIENDEEIVRFSSQNNSVDVLSNELDISKRSYYNTLLFSVFDFSGMVNSAKRWSNDITEIESSFDNETPEFTRSVINQITEIQDIALKFQHQLSQIFQTQTTNEELLQNRLNSASGYFNEKLRNLIETLQQSPAATDSRQNAKIYDDGLGDIFALAEQKKQLINGIKNGFNIELYFKLKNDFSLPFFTKTSYARNVVAKQRTESKHPQLMHRLFQLRNEICDEMKLPIYLVAGTRSIMEMSDYLPQNEKDMLHIYGFGTTKVERFGKLFLDCIIRYCRENNLVSAMDDLFESTKPKKERKEKPPKGESTRVTLSLYLDGKSISEIADERNLAASTIVGHLAKMVETGVLKIDRFVSQEKQKKALELLKNDKSNDSAYSILSTILNQTETSFMTAWMRGGSVQGKI